MNRNPHDSHIFAYVYVDVEEFRAQTIVSMPVLDKKITLIINYSYQTVTSLRFRKSQHENSK